MYARMYAYVRMLVGPIIIQLGMSHFRLRPFCVVQISVGIMLVGVR